MISSRNFVKMFNAGKTRMIWLPYGEKIWRYVKPFSSDTGTLRTDGQTGRIAISISHVSMLTRDKNPASGTCPSPPFRPHLADRAQNFVNIVSSWAVHVYRLRSGSAAVCRTYSGKSPKKSIQYRLSAYNEVQIDAREGKWIKTDSQTFME